MIAFFAPLLLLAATTTPPSDGEPRPRPINTPAPRWPPLDAAACRTGTVLFKAAIAPDGHIAEVVIVSSPTALMAESVTRTVMRQWRFEPFSRADGPSAPAWIRVPIVFDAASCHRQAGSGLNDTYSSSSSPRKRE